MNLRLSDEARKILLASARESILSRIENRTPVYPEPTEELDAVCGAFVTLRTGSGALRGCIGDIRGRGPLIESIKDTARASAFEDPRFRPLVREEADSTKIEISLLSPFVPVSDPAEVQPGRHGIYISRGWNSGLLLPQVAVEQQWDRDTFLTHGCFKAGLPGDAWRHPGTEIFIFTALVFSEPRNPDIA